MNALILLSCFLLSTWITYHFSSPNARWAILDHPNARSLHHTPIPRNGGLAIFAGLCVGLIGILWQYPHFPINVNIFLGLFLIACISYWDDQYSISPLWRLTTHCISAVLVILSSLTLDIITLPGVTFPLPHWLIPIISCLFIVWMINLYNFMDGMDGLAGGMAMIGFGWICIQAMLTGQYEYALLNAIIVSSSIGFLLFNFPPARIFMGDLGSSILGFLASTMILSGVQREIFDLWQAILVFSPFIVDATITLLQRLWRHEKVWQAHCSHYYQRLVLLGWSQKRTVLWEYSLMLTCAISASVAPYLDVQWQWVLMLAWCIIYSMQIIFVIHLEQTNTTKGNQ